MEEDGLKYKSIYYVRVNIDIVYNIILHGYRISIKRKPPNNNHSAVHFGHPNSYNNIFSTYNNRFKKLYNKEKNIECPSIDIK